MINQLLGAAGLLVGGVACLAALRLGLILWKDDGQILKSVREEGGGIGTFLRGRVSGGHAKANPKIVNGLHWRFERCGSIRYQKKSRIV